MILRLILIWLLWQPMMAFAQLLPSPPLMNGQYLTDYLSGPALTDLEMSPSGRWLSGVRQYEGKSYIMFADLDAMDTAPSYRGLSDDTFINWIEWANDDWIIASVTVYTNMRGDSFSAQDFEALDIRSIRDIPFPITRLILLKREGGDIKRVFEGDKLLERRNFNLGRVVSFLPDDPDHFLIAARLRGDLDLFRITVSTGEHERVGVGRTSTFAWYVDRNGEPAFRADISSRGTRVTYYGREDRENGDIRWRKLRSVRVGETSELIESATEFRPISPGPDLSTYYVAARPLGANTTGIYLYNFETDTFVQTLKSHPTIDIENALINNETYEYLGSYYYEDTLKLEFVDEGLQAHIDGLSEFFDGEVNLVPADTSRDGSRWLVRTEGPQDPGSYFVYKRDEAHVEPFGQIYPALKNERLAKVEILRFSTRDGLELTGYFTRPSDLPEGQIAPVVMMPHGGPELRDTYGYNATAQILAAEGYAVFQPNFRGSSGYGLAFADAGRRQWGAAMQTDIEDGLLFLQASGRAQAGHACIFGYSYGGYAAMAAATLTPDLYQCVIAGSGPTDLVKMLNWIRREDGSDSEEYEYWVNHIGHPSRDKDAIYAVSPARLADKVQVPVLLIHGQEDSVVPIEQSEIMAEALKEAGKTYQYLELENSGHAYRSGRDKWREYETILKFLRVHLTAPEPVVAAVAIDIDTTTDPIEAEQITFPMETSQASSDPEPLPTSITAPEPLTAQ